MLLSGLHPLFISPCEPQLPFRFDILLPESPALDKLLLLLEFLYFPLISTVSLLSSCPLLMEPQLPFRFDILLPESPALDKLLLLLEFLYFPLISTVSLLSS